MNSQTNPTMAVILAAGQGTRMESDLPKVLVPVCEKPMVRYVTDALATAGVDRIVAVVGYRADLVRAELESIPDIEFAEQLEQRGTGHAVMMCRQQLEQHDGPVFVVAGDAAMLQASSVSKLLDIYEQESPACIIGTVLPREPHRLRPCHSRCRRQLPNHCRRKRRHRRPTCRPGNQRQQLRLQ